jgi:hypothetical protein
MTSSADAENPNCPAEAAGSQWLVQICDRAAEWNRESSAPRRYASRAVVRLL